jgi:hypothetical protein
MTLPRERTSARQPAGQRNRPAQPAGWPVFCPHERPCSIGGDRWPNQTAWRNRRSIATHRAVAEGRPSPLLAAVTLPHWPRAGQAFFSIPKMR